MDRDSPPNMIPKGGFYTIKNFIATPQGLQRRTGLSYYAAGNRVAGADLPLYDIAPVWKTTGSQTAALLTDGYLYTLSGYSAPTQVYWKYTQGYISVSGATITGYGTGWNETASRLRVGDWIVLDADGTPETVEIGTITDNSTLIATTTPTGTYNVTNYITNGDCEAITTPTLDTSSQGLAAATWARSATQVKRGSYSWVLTKDGTATDGEVWLDDVGESATNDLHGLTAGTTYDLYAWMWTDVATVTNADLIFREYYAGSWHNTATLNVSTASTWELETANITLNAATTGVSIKLFIDGAEANKVLYIDDLVLITSGIDYEIRRRFNPTDEFLFDHTVADNTLLITDYNRPLYAFDGSTLTEHSSSLDYIAGCVTFFADRVWIANTIEDGSYYRQRIRWSSATNHESFGAADYLDLPYSSGAIKRILPLGPMMAVYAEDAVYFMVQSNNVDLPYRPIKLDTGEIGLIGSRGVTTAVNGHFFIGQDDVYFLTSKGLQKMNCPVRDPMITDCDEPNYIYAAQDPLNDRVVFGFPTSSKSIDKIWSYNYRSKAWSYDDVQGSAVTNPLLDLNLTWGDLPGILSADTWTGFGTDYATWADIIGSSLFRKLYVLQDGYVLYYSDNEAEDESGVIDIELETGDLDLDVPDIDKTFTRMTMKLAARPSANLSFTVTGSEDGGNSWKVLGTLTIITTTREGKINFRLTGSSPRIKLVENTSVESYCINEIVFRIAGRGLEYKLD